MHLLVNIRLVNIRTIRQYVQQSTGQDVGRCEHLRPSLSAHYSSSIKYQVLLTYYSSSMCLQYIPSGYDVG